MPHALTLVLVAPGLASVLAAPPIDNTPIVGVWRGKMDSLPAVTLTVEEEGGKLNGAVLFYLIHRNPGGEPSASPGVPEPLLKPTFDGATLAFEVSHRHAHPPRTLNDPPVKFRLQLTGPNKAKLLTGEGREGVEMVKDQNSGKD
jgi:hypothetical protein